MTTETGIPFEQICPYLPYGLKSFRIFGGQPLHGEIHVGNVMNFVNNETAYKPVLRPMCDLFAWMPEIENSYYGEAKKETGIDLDSDFSFDVDIEYSGTHRFALLPILNSINFLLKHHFDIFGLIGKGLAISIHEIDKK